jgi:ActR/RegA family two-component response regulator
MGVYLVLKTNRVLLVGDNDDTRAEFKEGLENHGFEVVPTSTLNQALSLIASEKFDVLLSDLHMPEAEDGLTVVNAMRHTQPNAVTLVMSGYPGVHEAMCAMLLPADEILVKPLGLAATADLIQRKLLHPSNHKAIVKEAAAKILDREKGTTIHEWLSRVKQNKELTGVPLSGPERTGHLPQLLSDLVYRLRLVPNVKTPISRSAYLHGVLRRAQNYTMSMLVEESRILQVSIFHTLQTNLETVDFSTVLLDVMVIADEVDSQLKQTVLGFMASEVARPASLRA